MPKITCCHCDQEATIAIQIESNIKDHKQLYLLLECCEKCNKRTLEVITVDGENKIRERKRIKTKNIDSFLKKNKPIKDLQIKRFQHIQARPRLITSEYSRKVARNRNRF